MPTIIITNWRCFILSAGILLAALAGCARLPDYAMPSSGPMLDDPMLLADAFTYRRLTRDDFQAVSLPPERAGHAASINAHACTQIRPGRDTRLVISRSRLAGSDMVLGSVQQIAFEAVLIPGCSWWNPDLAERYTAYVLQHEQIHFAITEVAARRLTAETRENLSGFMVVEYSTEDAKNAIAQKIRSMIKTAVDESLKTHTAFDEETSLFHSPRRQQWWMEKMEAALAAAAD